MADMTSLTQPIIRGIQAVGSVQTYYKFNGNGGKMSLPENLMKIAGAKSSINTLPNGSVIGVETSGYRLDGEFLRASQQIASSAVIPILGGGGVALTNNNRTGSLSFTSTKVSTPSSDTSKVGSMYSSSGSAIGVVGGAEVYDLAFLATVQQAQLGGDSAGATITIKYAFCDLCTIIVFEGCTVASVDPLALSGNDAANYPVVFNYLNWKADYSIDGTSSTMAGDNNSSSSSSSSSSS